MHIPLKTTLISLLLFSALLPACSGTEKKPAKEIIPITMANLRGHGKLYEEGWFIVTSSQKALQFAKEHSFEKSSTHLDLLKKKWRERTKEYADDSKMIFSVGKEVSKKTFQTGTAISGAIIGSGHLAGKALAQTSGKLMNASYDAFILGHMSLRENTKNDRQALMKLPQTLSDGVKSDFKTMEKVLSPLKVSTASAIENNWDEDFSTASEVWRKHYEKSSKQDNSIKGLFVLLGGYFKAAYHGIAKPSAKAIVTIGEKTARYTLKGLEKAVFLPVAGTLIIAGRTVYTTGLALYHTSSLGIKIITPTVTAGLLAALSIASAAATPVPYLATGSIGFVNQVAFTAASPIAGATAAAGQAAVANGKFVGTVTYDLVTASSQIIFNNIQSGVVLGYNALSALPVHTIMMGGHTVFFLAWDGPRLMIAAVNGSIGDAPVGTVMDLKKLREAGVEVNEVSTDEEVIQKVLQELPKDLRK